jgi:hypothetical protein
MTNFKKLSLGLVAATMLVGTPAMAQGVYQEPGAPGFYSPNSRYLTTGYGVRAAPRPGYYPRYYSGNQFHPEPRIGAFATAPWDDSYGSYGLVERQW